MTMKLVRQILHWIRSHKIISIFLLLAVGILVFLLRPQPAPPLETVAVKQMDLIQSISVSGSVNAKKIADLSFTSSGQLAYLGVKKGDSVTTGQTIAVLDQRSVLKSLQNSLLSYSLQRNTYDQNVSNNGGRISPNDAVNDSMKRIIQNNQYNLDQAVVSVELQDLARQQSILSSPINGIVTREDAVTVGSTVTPTSIFTIVDPTSLVLSMDVDEADIGKIQINQQVKVTMDAYPDTPLLYPVSAIDFISHTTTNGGNAFTVEVQLPANTASKYRVGMNGNAEIIINQRFHVLTIPQTSIIDSSAVYVKVPGGYSKRQIKTGLQNDIDSEVLSGLAAGDLVVLQPDKVLPSQIKPGKG